MSEMIAIVLAAGHGTRMKSTIPKVLHPACGRPLVYYPVKAALDLGASKVIVVVNAETRTQIEEELARHLPRDSFVTAVQSTPRGTGDAARVGMELVDEGEDGRVLILCGDTPLLRGQDLGDLLLALNDERVKLSFLTFVSKDPTGYGRVLRSEAGAVCEIREHRDLETDQQRAVLEVNAGVYAGRAGSLSRALGRLSPENAQGEYYLTDIVKSLAESGPVEAIIRDEQLLAGVNDRLQLSDLERHLFGRIREQWGKDGVSIVGQPLIDDTVDIAIGARIEDGVRLRGKTRIGEETFVDVGSVVSDSLIGAGVVVKPYCVITDSRVGDRVQVGPFAHLRPESVLEADVRIGNFVETKKTTMKRGAKANHLAYLGDAEIGEGSNLGAGTIVCNYDGFRKSRTTLGAGVFVGSDSQLIAPVTLGDGAYVATGTTVVRDVPAGGFAIGRVRQENRDGYADELRARLKDAADSKKRVADGTPSR
jgi:bifunctional UDP-N-acetylglucosamine pyrophosphorylase/glucosamine-1-phosphate N-acetyltransferase